MTKSEKTKQFIIIKTALLLNTKGLSGTSVSDITHIIKMSKGSLYGHFDNKEQLIYAAVDYSLQLYLDRIMAEANQFDTAKDKFIGLLNYLSDPLNPPVEGGCPMMNFGTEADDNNPVVRLKVIKAINKIHRWMTELLKKGIENNEFSSDWNYLEFITKAFAMIEGGIFISKVTGNISKMKILIDLLKQEVNSQVII